MIIHDSIRLETVAGRPSFHDITDNIEAMVDQNSITDGIIVISSSHTTCSLFFDEDMHDRNYFGDDFLHVDIAKMMDKIAPPMKSEGDYHSPGEKHIEFGLNLGDSEFPPEKWTMLNTDAHLKSSLFGSNSMTLIIKDKKILLGKLGKVFFVDWDQLRERNRNINIILMGEKNG